MECPKDHKEKVGRGREMPCTNGSYKLKIKGL